MLCLALSKKKIYEGVLLIYSKPSSTLTASLQKSLHLLDLLRMPSIPLPCPLKCTASPFHLPAPLQTSLSNPAQLQMPLCLPNLLRISICLLALLKTSLCLLALLKMSLCLICCVEDIALPPCLTEDITQPPCSIETSLCLFLH